MVPKLSFAEASLNRANLVGFGLKGMEMKTQFGQCLFLSLLSHGVIICGLGTAAVYARASIQLSNDVTGTIVSFAAVAANQKLDNTEKIEASEIATKLSVPTQDNSALASENKHDMRASLIRTRKNVSDLPRQAVEKTNKVNPNKTLKIAKTSSPQLPDISSVSSTASLASGMGSGERGKARVIKMPKPPYPSRALKMGFEGEVTLSLKIASDGDVVSGEISKSSGRSDCDYAALNTALQYWRFSPATLNGVPVASEEDVVVTYKIER